VMNCPPLPLPTFLPPAGSKGGPPLAGVEVAGGVSGAGGGAGAAPPPPKPQPSFPFWNDAPGPEQIPVGLAQQPLAQSASDRHCPVINCPPWPLPTFFAPAGSKGGTAATRVARAKLMKMVKAFMVIMSMCRKEWVRLWIKE